LCCRLSNRTKVFPHSLCVTVLWQASSPATQYGKIYVQVLSCGLGAVWAFPGLWGPFAEENSVIFGVFIGAALSISALPVIARILTDLSLINKEIGTVVMVAATMNDLIGWSLFAVVLSLRVPQDHSVRSVWFTLSAVGVFFVLTLSLGRICSQPVLRWLRAHIPWPGGFIAVMSVVVLLAAAMAETIGVHAFFGTFLVGVGLGQTTEEQHQVYEPIRQLAVCFFATWRPCYPAPPAAKGGELRQW
jgi:Kef-type K+ transport system membrane component KefB